MGLNGKAVRDPTSFSWSPGKLISWKKAELLLSSAFEYSNLQMLKFHLAENQISPQLQIWKYIYTIAVINTRGIMPQAQSISLWI